MKNIVVLSPDTTEFIACGTKYVFEENISIERYRRFNQLRLEAGYGVTVEGLREVLTKNIDFLERFAQGEKVYSEMVTLNYNALKGVVDLSAKEPYAVWMCTLFFNTEDEGRQYFKEEVMRKKIVDWTEAGIDVNFFIGKACAMISAFSNAYEAITQMSLGWLPGENPEEPSDPAE